MKISKAAIAAIFCCLFTVSSVWSASTSHDVVVVGAGTAGLYAAKTLITDGYDVLLIEATDRIGGRVRSHTLGSTRIEMGAEEHYTSNNPVYTALRSEYGNSIYVDGYTGSWVYSLDNGAGTCWSSNTATIQCSSVNGMSDF